VQQDGYVAECYKMSRLHRVNPTIIGKIGELNFSCYFMPLLRQVDALWGKKDRRWNALEDWNRLVTPYATRSELGGQ
jgi:hypothetical protein